MQDALLWITLTLTVVFGTDVLFYEVAKISHKLKSAQDEALKTIDGIADLKFTPDNAPIATNQPDTIMRQQTVTDNQPTRERSFEILQSFADALSITMYSSAPRKALTIEQKITALRDRYAKLRSLRPKIAAARAQVDRMAATKNRLSQEARIAALLSNHKQQLHDFQYTKDFWEAVKQGENHVRFCSGGTQNA